MLFLWSGAAGTPAGSPFMRPPAEAGATSWSDGGTAWRRYRGDHNRVYPDDKTHQGTVTDRLWELADLVRIVEEWEAE
jgi:hypothetical protein